MEQEATGIIGNWLAQLGIFGLGLAIVALFVILWLRESRAVRADTETSISRKNAELGEKSRRIADLEAQLSEAVDKERKTYAELMECKYPGIHPADPEREDSQ